MHLAKFRWLSPVPACIILQIAFGSFYAMGIFASREQNASFTFALGLSALFLSAGITLGGVLLHSGPAPPRRLAVAGAALLGAQCFLPYAIREGGASILVVAAAALGVGYGVIYVLSIAVIQAWVPERPGTATGMAIFSGGVGTLFFVALDTKLVNVLATTDRSIAVVGVFQSGIAFLAAIFISMPPYDNWHPVYDIESIQYIPAHDSSSRPALVSRPSVRVSESSPLITDVATLQENCSVRSHLDTACGVIKTSPSALVQGSKLSSPDETLQLAVSSDYKEVPRRLSIANILGERSFYILLVVYLASVGPGFGVILHGSRMQRVLMHVSTSQADRHFFVVTLIGVAGRLVVGIAVDVCAAYLKSCYFENTAAFKGAQFAIQVLLLLQTVALALVFIVIRFSNAILFVIILAVIYFTFSASTTVVACLCRSMYSRENSTLAFSLLGFSVGIGDIIFGSLVAASTLKNQLRLSQDVSRTLSKVSHASDYNLYFITALCLSLIGLILSFFLATNEKFLVPIDADDEVEDR